MYDLLKVVSDFAGLLISVVAISLVMLDRKGKSARETASRDDLKTIWEAIDDGRRRLAEVEANHRGQPSHGDLTAMRDSIANVGAAVATLNGVVSQLNKSLEMVNQHLLDRNG